MTFPPWWLDGVRVVSTSGQAGTIALVGPRGHEDWIIRLDGDEGDFSHILEPNPAVWGIEVKQPVTPHQLRRLVYDADRALCRAFGCGYVPEFESLPDSVRSGSAPCKVRLIGRPELDGIRQLVRSAIEEALAPHQRNW